MTLESLGGVGPTTLLFAALLGLGLWSVVAEIGAGGGSRRGNRVTSISDRVAISLRDVSSTARSHLLPQLEDPVSLVGVVLPPGWLALARSLDRAVGGAESTTRLLRQAGRSTRLEDYQLERLAWALAGAILVAFPASVLASTRVTTWWLTGVGALCVGALAGSWWSDRRLRRDARARKERIHDEFPTLMELLSLSLSAGDSLPGALRRVATRAHGELAGEWRRVLSQVDLGAPLGPTLRESASHLGVSEVAALVDHLVVSLDRGAPLAEIVRAHSKDARSDRLRQIVERSGRAEVAMLVPLVLLILPVTVLFAVWPGLQALQLSV